MQGYLGEVCVSSTRSRAPSPFASSCSHFSLARFDSFATSLARWARVLPLASIDTFPPDGSFCSEDGALSPAACNAATSLRASAAFIAPWTFSALSAICVCSSIATSLRASAAFAAA